MDALVFNVLVKAVVIFLAFIAVLGMFGRLRYPGQALIETAKCPRCGRFKIGKERGSCASCAGKE